MRPTQGFWGTRDPRNYKVRAMEYSRKWSKNRRGPVCDKSQSQVTNWWIFRFVLKGMKTNGRITGELGNSDLAWDSLSHKQSMSLWWLFPLRPAKEKLIHTSWMRKDGSQKKTQVYWKKEIKKQSKIRQKKFNANWFDIFYSFAICFIRRLSKHLHKQKMYDMESLFPCVTLFYWSHSTY